MFTDNMDVAYGGAPRILDPKPDEEASICHECAHELCDAVPWIASLLRPLHSHSHRCDEDWTDHEGWDLPHDKPGRHRGSEG